MPAPRDSCRTLRKQVAYAEELTALLAGRTRDRCAAAGRGAGRCFPGIKPHRPAPRSVPRCSNGEPAGQTHPNPPIAAVPRLPPARTGVRELRQSAPDLWPQRQPVGARPVLGGVRGPRVPSSGDRELRAPPYHQPRVWQCDPALLRCARVSRPRTRLSVTIRKLGVVLSSIPPDFARRTPSGPASPPDAGPHPCRNRTTYRVRVVICRQRP